MFSSLNILTAVRLKPTLYIGIRYGFIWNILKFATGSEHYTLLLS